MQLPEAVQKYLALAGGFGHPVPLERFGLARDETERIFGIFDEDYHMSRFIHFSLAAAAAAGQSSATTYQINGFPQTHVAIDAEIQTIL